MTRLLTDISGPFFAPERPFRNWSALPFYQLDLPHPPYVDRELLAWGVERAAAYLERIAAQGYTGVVIDNLAHLVTFDRAPERIYAPGSPSRLRALAYGEAFAPLFQAAAERGMEVFVTSDMQWATPELRRFAGSLAADNPRLAAANRWALEELFARFPQLSGVFVRVGEAGGAHDQGEAYTGHMLYRTAGDLRGLVDTLLPVCERHGRLLVVRTWSIGIGELGDLLWSQERYGEVFGGYNSPHLLVSVKHGPGDFFRHLPPNPTLGLPGPGQIVELQNRREYELFGMVPSGIAGLHGRVLAATAGSEQAAGVWAWNATGGWGGGSAAIGAGGWSLWTELSSALTAALARDSALDAAAFVGAWCAARLGPGPLATAAAALYLESERLVEHGWYMGPLPGGASLAGITLPTLLWVWWMRPTAAPLIWAYLAAAVPDAEACLAASRAAAARLRLHVARLVAAMSADSADGADNRLPLGVADERAGAPRPTPGDAAFVVESARYLTGCVEVALALRELLLPAFAAAGRGERAGWAAAAAGAPQVRAALAEHRALWGGRADFPALELDEVEAYLRRLERAPWALWRQARLAGLIVRGLPARGEPGSETQPLGAGGRSRHVLELRALGAGALALAALGAWRSPRARHALAGAAAAALVAAPLARPALRAALPWLSRRYNLLPSIFFETGPSFAEWTI